MAGAGGAVTIGAVFDLLLHAAALSRRDRDDLRFFGVEGALVPAPPPAAADAEAVRRSWEAALGAARALRAAGLAGYAALAVPPARAAARGLEALLADLPAALGAPEAAAVGVAGLRAGGPAEEALLARHLALARDLRLPVVVGTPARGREAAVRRVLALVREAEVEPGRVLVLHAGPGTVKPILACGHLAGVSLAGERALEAAVGLVRTHGPEGLALLSEGGEGGDLLALPRAADRLAKAGLTDAVVRRVCGANAVGFLEVDPGPLVRG